MNIQNMHYDFKMKLQKVDSENYRNFRIPEIDWALNEGMDLFIKMVANPRLRNRLGFEVVQRNRDDIRTLVKKATINITNNISSLPNDYRHFLRGVVRMSKNPCGVAEGRLYVRQHDDEFQESPYDSSSYEWREVNCVFNQDGIEFFTDGTFTVDQATISYIRNPLYMHNAAGFTGGTYNLPDNTTLSGTQNCELPEQTHREIVDIAVLIVTGQIQMPDYQIKLAKLNLNNLK
jgi:hypothetical protein